MKFAYFLFIILVWTDLSLNGQDQSAPDGPVIYPANVFVVTNRVIEKDEGGSLIFTNQVDTGLGLKYLYVTHTGTEFFSESFSGLDQLLEKPAMYEDWAVWVHGDGQSFLLSLNRAIEIQQLHKVNLLVFSWPTQAPDMGPIKNHKNSRNNAALTVPFLEELLSGLQEYRQKPGNRMENGNLSIFFHSLANLVLQLAIEQEALSGIREGLFDNLILNAPAVNSENHNLWVERLKMQDRVYICYNDEDINLEGLRVLSSLGLQLGERPAAPLAKNAVYIDFTASVGSRPNTGATHSYYYSLITRISYNIREFYTDLFHGRDVNFDDMDRFMPTDFQNLFDIEF